MNTILNSVSYEFTEHNLSEILDPDRGVTVVSPSGNVQELLGELLADAEKFNYAPAQAITTSGVFQKFTAFSDFPQEGLWFELGKKVSESLRLGFGKLGRSDVFATPLDLTDLTLQYYPKSAPEEEYALSAHRDQSGFVNLVVVMLLKGPSAFSICKDRKGSVPIEPRAILAKPGDLNVMRAGAFAGGMTRPCHFVGRVDDECGRLSLAFRQISQDKNRIEKLESFFGRNYKQKP